MSFLNRLAFAWQSRDKIQSMNMELRRLNERNADLHQQVRELLKAHPMTDEQLNDIAQVRKDNEQMRSEINVLTVYMRTRWPKDFQSGRHGARGLSEIVISYLAKIEDHHAAQV